MLLNKDFFSIINFENIKKIQNCRKIQLWLGWLVCIYFCKIPDNQLDLGVHIKPNHIYKARFK